MMTREYARRLHEGWPREFLMEAFGLTEDEYLEMFGICEEKEQREKRRKILLNTESQTVEMEVSGK